MAKLFMTVGLPASGKTAYFKTMLSVGEISGDTAHISSDAIREEVFGDVNDQNHNAEVFNLMSQRTIAALKNGIDVYYDATNISRKRRMAFIKNIRSAVKQEITIIALVFAPKYQTLTTRNQLRDRRVPEEVIRRMLRHFEVPSGEEGFTLVRVAQVGYNTLSEIDKEELKTMSHDNPHHKLTIGMHMQVAHDKYVKEACEYEYRIAQALKWHDIGKPFCKTFTNSKGEITNIAHYYNHENVGAYIYLSHSFGTKVDLDIALLINHHMDHFKGEKYLERMRKIYGDIFMSDLDIVHKYDVAAH